MNSYHTDSEQIYTKLCKQVPKLLWTRKDRACLLTVLTAYDKPCLCVNIHYYAPWVTFDW